jgi:hypothetical protein
MRKIFKLKSDLSLPDRKSGLELAPFSVVRKRLPRLHRAIPSAFLDKLCKELACGQAGAKVSRKDATSKTIF